MTITSIVTKPNIVTLLDQNEWTRLVRCICSKEFHVTPKTVHHQNSRLLNLLADFTQLARNTVDLLNIAIFSNDSVGFCGVASLHGDLLEVAVVAVSGVREYGC
jgi:hypothetical protein